MRRRWENRITRIEVLFIRPAEAVRHIPVKEEDLSRKRPCSRLRIRRFSLRASTVKIRSLDAGLFLTHVDVDHEVSGNNRDRGEGCASSPLTPPGVPARHRAVPINKHFAQRDRPRFKARILSSAEVTCPATCPTASPTASLPQPWSACPRPSQPKLSCSGSPLLVWRFVPIEV